MNAQELRERLARASVCRCIRIGDMPHADECDEAEALRAFDVLTADSRVTSDDVERAAMLAWNEAAEKAAERMDSLCRVARSAPISLADVSQATADIRALKRTT